MKPWDIEVFGGPVSIGACTHVIATPDKRVRLTVWSTLEGRGRMVNRGNIAFSVPASPSAQAVRL